MATGLDPGNATVRSYLGRAYDDERRDDRAAGQYGVAKRVGPARSDAVFLGRFEEAGGQPAGRCPGGGIERSIDLNDNRAPFRSQPALDEDLATRAPPWAASIMTWASTGSVCRRPPPPWAPIQPARPPRGFYPTSTRRWNGTKSPGRVPTALPIASAADH